MRGKIAYMNLDGELGLRIKNIMNQWLISVPDANPGLLEMFRLKYRTPSYGNPPEPWSGEFMGKYLQSAIPYLIMTQSKDLEMVVRSVLKELEALQESSGYLGPWREGQLSDHWDLWGHNHLIHGLLDCAEYFHESRYQSMADKMGRLITHKYLRDGYEFSHSDSMEMNMGILHGVARLYRLTSYPEYLEFCHRIVSDFEKQGAGDYYRLALAQKEFYTTSKPRWESLHCLMGLCELSQITGDVSYLDAVIFIWDSIFKTDIHQDGSFSTHEKAMGNPFESGPIETCCTVAWMWLTLKLYQITQAPRYVDALEWATLNASRGFTHPSGRWFTYDTPMKGHRISSAQSIVFQARAGTPELNCCSMSAPQALGLLTQWAFTSFNHRLQVNYYGSGEFHCMDEEGLSWIIRQETEYPVHPAVVVRIISEHPIDKTIQLRIPQWSLITKISINAEEIEMAKIHPGEYVDIHRNWSSGDTIRLELDFTPRLIKGDIRVQNQSSLIVGPLVLAYDQKWNAHEVQEIQNLEIMTLKLIDNPFMNLKYPPMVCYEIRDESGHLYYLGDFGMAGVYGTYYQSWLPVKSKQEGRLPLLYGTPVIPVEYN